MHGIEGWRRAVLWPLVALVKAWGRTLRFDMSAVDPAMLAPRVDPAIFVLWHNRLFAVPELYRRYWPTKRIHALISASKDGAWLAAFFELAGLGAVRGSSSKFGREALHALAERLDAGDDVGLTPDGPRGPAYKMKGGGVLLARKSGRTSILMGINYENAWRIPSWDRFCLPVPWSTVKILVEKRTSDELSDGVESINRLESDMNRLNPDPLAPSGVFQKARPQVI